MRSWLKSAPGPGTRSSAPPTVWLDFCLHHTFVFQKIYTVAPHHRHHRCCLKAKPQYLLKCWVNKGLFLDLSHCEGNHWVHACAEEFNLFSRSFFLTVRKSHWGSLCSSNFREGWRKNRSEATHVQLPHTHTHIHAHTFAAPVQQQAGTL